MSSNGFKKKVTLNWLFTPHNIEAFAPRRGSKEIIIFNKPDIAIPTFNETLAYTGSELTAVFNGYDENKMTVSGNTGTNAGEYTAVFTPKDGYEWSDGDVSPKEVVWRIGPTAPIVTPTIETTFEYGTLLSTIVPSVVSNTPGTFSWITTDEEFVNMISPATVAWKFLPDDSNNYTEVVGTMEVVIDEIDIDNLPSTGNIFTYDGTVKTPTWSNYDPEQLTISGDISGTNAGVYVTTFTPTEKYEWTDGTREPRSVQWSIEHAVVDVPTISGTYTYTGNELTAVFNGYDENKMSVNGDTSATAAGEYSVIFTLKDTSNYKWSDGTTTAKSVQWTIGQADGSGTVSIQGWTYGEAANAPTPQSSTNGTASVTYLYESIDGRGYSGSTAPDDVGNYRVTATFAETNNYKSCTAQATFTIEKASLTMTITPSKTVLSGGGTVTLTVGGLPTGGSVTITCDNTTYNPTGSGTTWTVTLPNSTATYVFTASFAGDDTYNGATASCTVYVTYKSSGGGGSTPTVPDDGDDTPADTPV